MLIRILLLVSLTRLLTATGKPVLCAALYGGVFAFFGLISVFMGEMAFLAFLLFAAIRFVLALVFFLLLDRFEESGLYWVILILGFGIGLV